MNIAKFLGFLESLSSDENKPLLEAVKSGFRLLFETPHADTLDGRSIDLHVEDVLVKNGPAIALQYVKEMIKNIQDNNALDIPLPGLGEISHLDDPLGNFSSESVKDILFRLRLIENGLSEKIHLQSTK